MIHLRLTRAASLFDSFMQPMPADEEQDLGDTIYEQQGKPITTDDHSAVKCDFEMERIELPYPFTYIEGALDVHHEQFHGKFSIGTRYRPNMSADATLDLFKRRYMRIYEAMRSGASESLKFSLRYLDQEKVPLVVVVPNFKHLEIDVNFGQGGAKPLEFSDLKDFETGLERVIRITQNVLNAGQQVTPGSKPNKDFLAYINFNRENYCE